MDGFYDQQVPFMGPGVSLPKAPPGPLKHLLVIPWGHLPLECLPLGPCEVPLPFVPIVDTPFEAGTFC